MLNRKYIATQLHTALEMAPDDDVLNKAAGLPHYVIDEKLIEILGRSDIQKTVAAMIEAEIARLPYPDVVIEFQAGNFRRFVVLHETPSNIGFTADLVALGEGALSVSIGPCFLSFTPGGLAVRGHASLNDGLSAAFAAAIALMMLNTRGIARDVIQPTQLNIARITRGRPKVPTHTVVHIGSYYDRNDVEHRLVAGGRHVALHYRHGHVRNQAKGPGHAERELIYIQPVFVNFSAGDTPPVPRKVLTR